MFRLSLFLLCLPLLAQPRLETWRARWTPYRLIDDAGVERTLLKARVDLPAQASGMSLALVDGQGRVLDQAPIAPGKARGWDHGFWAPSSFRETRLVVEVRQGAQVLSRREVTLPAPTEAPAALPLRMDRLNRGLLDRLVKREAPATIEGGVDITGYLAQHDIVYQSPAPSWVEGLPLGNGDVGALVWGKPGAEQVIHLDKTGIWYAAPDGTALGRSYAGTLRLRYKSAGAFAQRLSLARAEVETRDGEFRSTARVDAHRNRFELEVNAREFEIVLERQPVTLWVNRRGGYLNAERLFGSWAHVMTHQRLAELRAEAARAPTTRVDWGREANACWFTNTAPNLSYSMLLAVDGGRVQWTQTPEGCVGRVTANGPVRIEAGVATSREARDPASRARAQLGPAARAAHLEWWRRFWSRSWIELPDKLEENLWYMGVYQQAACSRSDQAVSFFGLWHPLEHRTWYDAYVSDAQVPMIWWLCFSTNHLELLYPSHRTFARYAAEFARYTGHDGMVVPHFFHPEWAGGLDYVTGSNTHKGATSWFVMNFWWDYLYSGDRVFLREVTYPLLRMAADFFTGYLIKESDGRYHLLDSNSPEQDGTKKDNTFDWSLLRFLYRASIQASETLGVDAELRSLWRERLDNLYALPGDRQTVWECSTVAHPYRCHPVVMFTLHPTNALDYGTPEYERARRTMEPVTRLFGFRYEDRHAPIPAFEGGVEPNGFSSGILTTSAARLGGREMYRRFLYGLIIRFHMKQNGLRALIDTRQSDDISRSSLVEAANAHTVAITETLVQSWRDHVRLFGCIEKKGRYRFSGLRAAPGVALEAEAVDGTVRHLKAKCVAAGQVKLVWPGGERAIDCTPGVTHTLVGDPASRIALEPVAPAGERHAPRRVLIDTVENMVEPLVHYPENLPFAQVVEDDYLYLGRPAKFAAPRTRPDPGVLQRLASSAKWQERQRAARLFASVPAEPGVLSQLDRLCADSMNVVAHTAAVSLVHVGTPEALSIAGRHAARDAVPGLRREVEKARQRLRR
jgi:hypothetical protein